MTRIEGEIVIGCPWMWCLTTSRSFQGTVVDRSAQHQPQQRRPGGDEAADRPVHGCIGGDAPASRRTLDFEVARSAAV
jgi:hypothetical protein